MATSYPHCFNSSIVSLPPLQKLAIPPRLLKPALESHSHEANDQPCVLVIDDDPNILLTVRAILEFEGYQVETATNGVEGFSKAMQIHPGLILLDMRMPVMDGWGFAKQKEDGVDLPIVVITAARDASRWAAEIGAVGHLDKPFDLLDLLDVVEHWCPKP